MSRFDDLDRALTAYLDQEAAAPAPSFLLPATMDAVSRREPRPALVARLASVRRGGGQSTPSRMGAIAIAVATLLLALVAIGLIAGGSRPPSLLVDAPSQPATSAVVVVSPTPVVSPGTTPIPVNAGEPWIAYMNNIGAADTDRLYLVRPDGGDRHQLPTGLDGQQEHPDWSPDGSRIVFDHGYTDPDVPGQERRDLWIINADGSGATQLAACDLPCLQLAYPAWSPDGTSVAYIRSDRQTGDDWGPAAVEILDLASGTTRTVISTADGATAYYELGWSPDGSQLAFGVEAYTDATEATRLSASIATVHADGSDGATPRILTPADLDAAEPDWHPDGDRIAFRTRFDPADPETRSVPTDIEVINVDGTGLVNLTNFGLGNLRAIEPSWTPDGTRIVFTQVDGFGVGQLPAIALMDADGSNVTRLGFATGTVPRMRPTP